MQREIKDPRIGFVTITRVELSSDGHYAKIFVSVLGNEEEIAQTMEGLNHAMPFVRAKIAQRLQLRYAPQISFQYDPSLFKSQEVQALLDSLAKEE